MTTDRVREAISAQPFRPFTIHMADGRSYDVRHREFITQTPGGRIVVVVHGEDSVSILDLLLINELRFENAPSKSSKKSRKNGNGSH